MEDWITGVILALFIIILCWLALSRRQEVQKQINAWPELALRTGMTYTPGYSVHGEYRGRCLSLIFDRELIGSTTRISLDVLNSFRCSLFIQAKSVLDYIRKNAEVSSGNQEFDRHFSVTGSPRQYAQGAVNLIVHSDSHLLAWIMQKSPSVELKGEHLGCDQNGELTNVDDQLALLNLLCDLAELAEEMESDDVKLSGVGREKYG